MPERHLKNDKKVLFSLQIGVLFLLNKKFNFVPKQLNLTNRDEYYKHINMENTPLEVEQQDQPLLR